MNIEEVKQLANADGLVTAVEIYDIMGSYPEENHKKNCVENTLLPMVYKHIEMAKELLKVYEAVAKVDEDEDDLPNFLKPQAD